MKKAKQIVEAKVEVKKDVLLTKEDKIALINAQAIETIIWIVGVGILQFILNILSKKFF